MMTSYGMCFSSVIGLAASRNLVRLIEGLCSSNPYG